MEIMMKKPLLLIAHLIFAALLSSFVYAQNAEVKADDISAPSVVERVDINSADADLLAKILVGVGPSKAKAIVAWREENGPFKHPEELVEVKGIGQKIYEKNIDRIIITPTE